MTLNKIPDADVARGERAARKVIKELGVDHPTETSIGEYRMSAGVIVRWADARQAKDD